MPVNSLLLPHMESWELALHGRGGAVAEEASPALLVYAQEG